MKTNRLNILFYFFIVLSCFNHAWAKETPKLQASSYEVLSKAQKDMEKFDYKNAKIKLQVLLNKEKLPAYDKAVTYQTLGYAENGIGNFKAAAEGFQNALSLNILPDKVTHDLQFATAQLLIHLEKPDQGLDYLKKWFSNEPKPNADSHIVAASAYYQLKNYEQLIFHVEQAIRQTSAPRMDWYDLLLAAYFEQKNYRKAAQTLELIVTIKPNNKGYWLQLAGMYQELKEEKQAVAAYELAYQKKLLSEEEIKDLINLYLYLEMPYKAANTLEKELAIGGVSENQKNLTLLADSWLLAKEYDKAKSLFQEIVNRYKDDKTRLRLGRLYIESEKWKEAVAILKTDIKNQDKSLKANINLLLGIAQYNLNQNNLALNAFSRALNDKSTVEQARWWLDYLKKTNNQAS